MTSLSIFFLSNTIDRNSNADDTANQRMQPKRCKQRVTQRKRARSLPRPSSAPLPTPPPPPPPPPSPPPRAGGVRLDRRRRGSRCPSQWSAGRRSSRGSPDRDPRCRTQVKLSWWGGWPTVAAVAAAVATVAATGGSRIAPGRASQPGDAASRGRREDLLYQPVARVSRL